MNELENNGLLNQRTIFQKKLEQTIKIFFFKHKGKHGAIPKTIPPTNLLVSILRAPQLDVKKMKKNCQTNFWKKIVIKLNERFYKSIIQWEDVKTMENERWQTKWRKAERVHLHLVLIFQIVELLYYPSDLVVSE